MLYKLYRYVHACMMVRRVKHKKYSWWIGWICAEGFDMIRWSKIRKTSWLSHGMCLDSKVSDWFAARSGTSLNTEGHREKFGQICLDIWDWTILDLSKVSKAFDIFWSWSSWQFDFDCQLCACNLQWHSFAWWAWWVDGLIRRIDSPMFHKTLKWDGYDHLNASISFTSGPCIHFRAVSTKPCGWWFRMI